MTRRIPNSTYRLQLHKGFTFNDAAAIAPYLWDLGLTHVYSSPYLQAAPGSMHGYDVVDHGRVNEELGGWMAHERFSKRLGENGLGQVLDIVPNHMALGEQNRFWWDVLENGISSRYASFFDIDWQPQEERLRNKVLVPILADQYGRALQEGGVKVLRNSDTFLVEASGQILPVAPHTLAIILNRAAETSKSNLLSFVAASFARLPAPEENDRRSILARHRDKEVLYALLKRLGAEEPSVGEAIDRAIAALNSNLDALDDFLNQQHYRLSYWKTADQQLGYRRFFDVNTLIGLRMEREHVFEETHALIIDWLHRGVLDGVRVDHPDGLRDPLEYFKRLREHVPEGWIIGEKILEQGEFLREEWPIDGTSGYDFLNAAAGVLVSQAGMAELNVIYGAFTDELTDFPTVAHEKKINVTQESLGSDVNRLTSLFVMICECNRNQRDYTRAEIRRAIREVAACFSVYRTYVVPARGEITDEDRDVIRRATECAQNNRGDIDAGLFDFMRDVLFNQVHGKHEAEFVLRFQQFTSPVMAKGVEDTAFYCYDRLTGMNEVGSDPGKNGISVDEFHAYNSRMQATHPLTMTTLSTHDTKRADDVRARLAVLTEIPSEFSDALRRWSGINEQFRTGDLPDRNTEDFLYQTLLGAWPIDAARTHAYMQKAMREAKQMTSWVANNAPYEDALNHFIDAILGHAPFLADFEKMVERILHAGRINSLAQTLLKYTSPGVPDLYQGSELWDLSLVDPDNRRPVDYALRTRLLAEIKSMAPAAILARSDEGLPKLWTVHHSLRLRREHPEFFGAEAAYTPIAVSGAKQDHAIAYLRSDRVATVVPRLPFTLGDRWEDTALNLPQGTWRSVLGQGTLEVGTGGRIAIADVLKDFPVALLVRQDHGGQV